METKFDSAFVGLNQALTFDRQTGEVSFGGTQSIDSPIGTQTILSLMYAMRSFNLKPSKDPNNPVNDTRVASFDVIYSRLVDGIGEAGDVLVGLSTSGNSANIVKAFEVAGGKKMITIAFTGITGGTLKAFSNVLINVPSSDTPRIQESHIMIGHIICQLVEENLFPSTN